MSRITRSNLLRSFASLAPTEFASERIRDMLDLQDEFFGYLIEINQNFFERAQSETQIGGSPGDQANQIALVDLDESKLEETAEPIPECRGDFSGAWLDGAQWVGCL